MYSKACMPRKTMPSSTVSHIQKIVHPRLPSISRWCAMVRVTPDVSSSAVLMVGIGQGPIVVNGSTVPAGDAVKPGSTLGHTALKSGHSTALARLPRLGTDDSRAQYSAPKNAPKNITSEKMNQLMLQRNDTSTRWLYKPPSLSAIDW